MARVILFDVLGTLVRDPFFDVMPGFFGMTLAGLLAAKHPTRWLDFEHGDLDECAFLEGFFADGRDFDHAGFVAAIEGAYAWLPGMEALLASVALPCHALSNYPVWYRRIEQRLGLSRYLDWSFVSCETGVRKPDPAAYLGPVRALGLAPQDCLFVDDRQENVDAAQALGLDAVRFTSAEVLGPWLAQRGATRHP
jgi:FMN hydrolase / 5-amino-6-(5-phospho-D-ribitylamino)uracil phosphatase